MFSFPNIAYFIAHCSLALIYHFFALIYHVLVAVFSDCPIDRQVMLGVKVDVATVDDCVLYCMAEQAQCTALAHHEFICEIYMN